MDTKDLRQRKEELEQTIEEFIKKEVNKFAEDTGLGIKDIRFNMCALETLSGDGGIYHVLSSVECEVEI